MRRVEHQHNTPDQVKEYLETALAIVDELEVDDDLKVPAFVEAVHLVAGKQITFEQLDPAAIGMLGQRLG